MKTLTYTLFYIVLFCSSISTTAQQGIDSTIEKQFAHPGDQYRPWVFWYWMHGAISRNGITADVKAMREAGIAGAYLMTIKDTTSAVPFQPTVRQLTPEWWQLVKFAMEEAKRDGLKLAMHVSDGFALAGGPWITPELSMQKLVWTKSSVKAGIRSIKLDQPEATEGYYRDIAVYAYPANGSSIDNDVKLVPTVTTSNGTRANFLAFPNEGRESFRSDTACWIQYHYPKPFTCRSIRVHVGGNNYQAHRLIVQAGDDGINFKTIVRFEPPRHGWQDTDEDVTHSIPPTTATYFRFLYNKDGAEPGAEDIDAAKWKPSFKVEGIYLSGESLLHHFESKNGSVWRVSKETTTDQVSPQSIVPMNRIINLTRRMDSKGNLNWSPPNGDWVVLRIGHTSTGHTNATGGGGKGLECDKFNPQAVRMQFENWFARAFDKTDPALAREVLEIFHVDSWECGSQNWSRDFAKQFRDRRGYDPLPYLPAAAGIPVGSLEISEKFLQDFRKTIAELVNDVFYKTLKNLSAKKDTRFSAESVAPTMVSDGLLHYGTVDLPMGEFWLNSPTHDKPNDMHDAISGAHIYGKNVVQAEAFTSVRMNWREHPGNLKAIGDRNFALGINRMVLHVYTHNPWMDRKPGMTLDGVGLYFQRDQTWFRQSRAWIDYLSRCQVMLQQGKPVVDIAVFTGDEIPSRAILPDRLVTSLPGIFGKNRVEAEKKRLANAGHPMRSIPDGVNHSANMADPIDWVNPLNGYSYDSFNPDALMKMSVKNGQVLLPGGATYRLLLIPAPHPLQPNRKLSVKTLRKLQQLARQGATILIDKSYQHGAGLNDKGDSVKLMMNQLVKDSNGKVYLLPHPDSSFAKQGIARDVDIEGEVHSIAWSHRKSGNDDIYFISNQRDSVQKVNLSFRVAGKTPEVWDPVTGAPGSLMSWEVKEGRTFATCVLHPNQSLFIIFRTPATERSHHRKMVNIVKVPLQRWTLQLDTAFGGPAGSLQIEPPSGWTESDDPAVKYYSGTGIYTTEFRAQKPYGTVLISFESISDIATVYVNDIECGTLWTPPFSLDITKALQPGINRIRVEVTNTWANRLIGDQLQAEGSKVTWTTAPFRLKNKPLSPAGITGRVYLDFK